jgi:hypothetical protein
LITSNISTNRQVSDDAVLIVENIGEALSVQNNSTGGAVLEGVCAVFGQMNNNRRVYEKDD